MDVTEVLKLADDLVFSKTGKHLDNLQAAILRGTFQREKYSKIAEDFYCTEGHIKDVSSQLWKIFSEALGETIHKSNLRSTLERCHISHSSNFGNFVKIGKFSVCDETLHPPYHPPSQTQPKENETKPKNRHDLTEAPATLPFYGRTQEISILKNWILEKECRLIGLFGISGMGKTALAVQLIKQIKNEFDFIIWRSLNSYLTCAEIQINLIEFISDKTATELPAQPEARLSILMEYLRQYRCLVVLDDWGVIFSSGQLAGHYQTGFEDYGVMLKKIAELSHNSCFLVAGWEPPKEIVVMNGEKGPMRCLQLLGLDDLAAQQILRDKGVIGDNLSGLIERYQGNPLWLKIVAGIIQDLFDGSVCEFFKYDSLFLGQELQTILAQQYNRLSDIEKAMMRIMAEKTQPASPENLIKALNLSPTEVFNSLQSLTRRSLIEKNQTDFILKPIFRQYVKIATDLVDASQKIISQ